MPYPVWDNSTSYPVNTIVSFNGLLYIATFYHNPASNSPPNVETGLHPSNPGLFGLQRSWTLYSTLPTGYSASDYVPDVNILTKPVDVNDQYNFLGATVPGIYGNDQGIAQDYYPGTPNATTTPCPANKCILMVTNGLVYGNSFQEIRSIMNPVLGPSGYYIDGPTNYPAIDTLYVWWGIQAAYGFRRTVTLYCDTIDSSGNPLLQTKTFTPTDDNYNVGPSTPIGWYAPGNESTTFTSYSGVFTLHSAYEIDAND
jgi:hypothetical protein